MKTYLSCALFCLSLSATSAHATSIELGGFLKANARYVDGNIAFQDSWSGGGRVVDPAKETANKSCNLGIERGFERPA
ncbi:hypothetical protein [Shewanella sp. Isolate7]|uniref:hypothetical protein n=1 Tax=Shewanella sp. Isolate7 TaxID=2908528 RepID=UPI001EFDDBB5|nr:hypothetical protein [Shewanella sp. Isolate7]MCG9723612.1 hypothetical protein [Shewanella sp. Isolate7]